MPPPAFVIEELARAWRAWLPTVGGYAGLSRRGAPAWMNRRFGLELGANDLAACVGTKEFVASLAQYLHLRTPERDTVLYPVDQLPDLRDGRDAGGTSSGRGAHGRRALDLGAIDARRRRTRPRAVGELTVQPTGASMTSGAIARVGESARRAVASDECYAEFTWAGRPRSILEHGSSGVLAVHSISKRSNLAGFRAGFYAGDEELVAYLRSVRQHAGFMVPGPVQAAAALAYGDDEHVNVQRERYLRDSSS